MEIFKKVFASLLASVLLCASVLPSVSNAVAAIATVTKAPVATILSIIGVGAGLNAQSYYTIYQYSYPRKCEAIPYANHTVFYQDASRNKVTGTADSAKFFSSQPYPIGCTP
ncbi:hypothetical protein HPL003_05285 [Paenibacillus terrae HPL-003]|uniref:Uncharacterized protein n=1 Tax=Paenibacillus terrae (strain HPL-003) TaxID=985665 RepID=G7VY39_PAETH|nr:hypothetical protein [Paenibacillus terrae]AET57822.1 hypothetical protein HPL003_05285 [Paenibacillus terrae HPL-003]